MQRLFSALLLLPRPAKRAAAVALDIGLCALSVWVAFYLRLDSWVALKGLQWLAIAISVALALPIFVASGLYRAIFRHSGLTALTSVVQAAIVYGAAYATIITFIQIQTIPRTIGIIQPLILFLFVAASRVLISWVLGDNNGASKTGRKRQSVLIYGAGSAGRQLCMALGPTEMRVAGFIDDDEGLQGKTILGRPIYPPGEMEALVAEKGVTDILLAIPSASRQRRNEILEFIRPLNVKVRTIPGLTDLAQGRVETKDLRELDIDDLLGRGTVAPDPDLLIRNIHGKTVLVSGAGGSIGSELCRQILAAEPESLLLVDISEPALYAIHHELEQRRNDHGLATALTPLLGSAADAERMREIFSAWEPETVYHAAAYKHVPLVEHNPGEGVWNNVFGTLTTASVAREFGAADFVLISTDKAVRPSNVMGASKRLSEQVLQAMADGCDGTRFSMVRFGNVLGSSGSVVPLFRRQIQDGGPVTVTHQEMTRYFMTIPEAAQLVIQAGAMAEGGEVFVLDMGAPIRIVELARKMIELSGLTVREPGRPDGDIGISFIGLRPGEKLYEELLIGNDPHTTRHPRIMKANEAFLPWPKLEPELTRLRRAIKRGDVAALIEILRNLVPEYTPKDLLVDFVHLRKSGT